MRYGKILFAALTSAAVLAVSVSSADARWSRHRGPGPVAGLLGGVVVGAATIATLPFAVLGAAARSAPPPGPAYYGRQDYGPPPRADYYGRYDGYGAPPPPPPRYYRRYDPPPGYYRDGY